MGPGWNGDWLASNIWNSFGKVVELTHVSQFSLINLIIFAEPGTKKYLSNTALSWLTVGCECLEGKRLSSEY